ncbi:MAG TPA: AAA family ATPase, partial [Spirochaetota bacterium]|nr:AAA family ATPase [Spirochaetota bacterium]
GNGKTMLGKILCSNMGVPFFIATADDFKMGVNNQKIEKLYITASMYAPSIVYIEDADIFLQQRQYNLNGFTLSGFLNLIDGLKENTGVITIITCNSPELLDEAVKNRPKRFDVIIEFPNPALEQRIEILQVKLKEHIKEEDSDYLSSIAGKMHGFSGAHITEFADRLIMSKIYSDIEFVSRELMDRELENFSFRPSGSNTIGLR